MSSLTNQEYLDLVQKLVDQQYDDAEDQNDVVMEWIPSESEAKKKMVQANTNGVIDLTNVKSGKIKESLFKCTNLQVGSFKIRITRYNGAPSQDGTRIDMDLEVYEAKTKTPSGHPCKVDYPVDFYKDNRFANKSWIKYFRRYCGDNVPADTVVEIIRWFQAVTKLNAFL
jgi:hypothetical protein